MKLYYLLKALLFIVLVWDSSSKDAKKKQKLPECKDSFWCDLPMPKASLFPTKFEAPTDPYRWQIARIQARNGAQVLLTHSLGATRHYLNILDGDIKYRQQQAFGDLFLSKNQDFSGLIKNKSKSKKEKQKNKKIFDEELPSISHLEKLKRAPIVFMGYSVFGRLKGEIGKFRDYHHGEFKTFASYSIEMLIKQFNEVKDLPNLPPFILYHGYMNENWGFLSTHLENRTVNWGECCTGEKLEGLLSLLSHPKVLMMVVGGHFNITHPKIVNRPIGIQDNHNGRLSLFDTMHTLVKQNKSKLMFGSVTNSIYRSAITDCVKGNFPDPKDFTLNMYCIDADAPKPTRANCSQKLPLQRFHKILTRSRVAFTPPGAGYDTYRLWESLYLGVMPIVEKRVGLDKAVYGLPVLVIDDWGELTPEMVKSAYVEALYRAPDFEWHKLNQHWWYDFVMNVSVTSSSQTVYDAFPPKAEDATFTRPRVRYDCGADMEKCGPGTLRTPRKYC